jgi:hypothetical protein
MKQKDVTWEGGGEGEDCAVIWITVTFKRKRKQELNI